MSHPQQKRNQASPERPSWWLFWAMLLLGVALAVMLRLLRERLAVAPAPAALPSAPPPEPVTRLQPAPVEASPTADVSAAATPPAPPPPPDDLTRLEGIGPKISGWLNEAGITTFAQVAALTPEQLAEILLNAGHRLSATETWPEQAAFAAAGQWDELAEFQSTLRGGRRK